MRLFEIHLLGSYSCARLAVQQAERFIADGGEVYFYVFRQDLGDFLSPLEKDRVHVIRISEVKKPRLFHPMTWISCRRDLRSLRQTHFDSWRDADVFAYNTGFSLSEMTALATLSSKNRVTVVPCDGRFTDPRMKGRAKGWKARVYAGLLGWITGIPIEMAPWPAPVIKESFLRTHCVKVLDAPIPDQRIEEGPCMRRLRRSTTAEVIWFHEDFVRYYGEKRVCPDVFRKNMEMMVQEVSRHVPRHRQAVKVHPGDTQPLPSCFEGMEELERVVPSEFYEFPNIRLVIAAASCAMQPFLQQEKMGVISNLYLLGGDESVLGEGKRLLKERLDVEGRAATPKSIEQFGEMIRSALIRK